MPNQNAKQKIAERQKANAAVLSNLSALRQGVSSIPGRVVKYIKTSTPSDVARDVGDVASSTFSALKEDPAGFIGDAIFSPFAAVRDIGDLRSKAAELRRMGRNAEAQKLEALAGTMVLSAIPIVGKVAGTAVRNAEKSSVRSATGKAAKASLKAEPKPKRGKYQPVEPVESPHPELADVEFPSGSGKGGKFAVERKVPIVGRRPFVAQSPGGYSRLAGGLPANQVTVESQPFLEMPARQFIDPHDLVKEFRSVIPFVGDKLRGAEEIISISGRPQEGYSRVYSGPDFARQQMAAGGNEVWASGPSVISALDRMALEGQEKYGGPVAGIYTAMGPEAVDQTTAMIDTIGRQIAAGNISAKDQRAFDDLIRNASRKDDEPIPNFVGFENDPLAAIDQLNDVRNISMGQRRTLTQAMNAKPWLEAGFPDIGANRAGLTIPDLLYAPEGTSGYMISALEPGKGALPDEAVSMRHPNYLKKLGGTYLGGFEVGVPRELVWSNLYGHPDMQKYEQFRQLGYLFTRPPREIRADFGHDPRIQPLDTEWADRIAEYIEAVKKYGEEPYASGGRVVDKAFSVKGG